MSKIKQLVSEKPCTYCNMLYPAERAKVFPYCLSCATTYKLDAKNELPIISLGKMAYQAYSHEAAIDIVKQTNPKRTI